MTDDMYLTDDDFDLHKVKKYIQKLKIKTFEINFRNYLKMRSEMSLKRNKNSLFSKIIL